MRPRLALVLLLMARVTTAEAHDIRAVLRDLEPCMIEALRLCYRSEGRAAIAVRRCEAVLAVRRHEMSKRCVGVLNRYGQL